MIPNKRQQVAAHTRINGNDPSFTMRYKEDTDTKNLGERIERVSVPGAYEDIFADLSTITAKFTRANLTKQRRLQA